MNAFLVELENKPGELARVTEAIAAKGVNIEAFSGSTCDTSGTIAIVTNDDAGTREALGEVGCTFRESKVTKASIGERPGSLAAAARRLADAGVNIEAAFPIGMDDGGVKIAFVTNNAAKAKEALATTTAGG